MKEKLDIYDLLNIKKCIERFNNSRTINTTQMKDLPVTLTTKFDSKKLNSMIFSLSTYTFFFYSDLC